jgi:hypothetical protein
MDKLLDHLKNINYEIDVDCFTKASLSYKLPETLQLSVSFPMSPPFGNDSEDLYLDKFYNMILSEMSQSIVKKILQYIFDNGKKSFIDLTNHFGNPAIQFENAASRSRKTISKLYNDLPQKYLVTNGRISSDYFMDSSAFIPLPISNKIVNSSGLIYPSGSIHLQTKREVWVDPFMRWNDNHILCFDEVRLDISNLSFSMRNEDTFSPKVLVSLYLRFEIINPEVFFIYEDDYKKNWDIQSIVKKENRDTKIDYILDGNKESGPDSQFGIYLDNKLES